MLKLKPPGSENAIDSDRLIPKNRRGDYKLKKLVRKVILWTFSFGIFDVSTGPGAKKWFKTSQSQSISVKGQNLVQTYQT